MNPIDIKRAQRGRNHIRIMMEEKTMSEVFGKLQKVGKALMMPVAVLPVAALLLRFGAGDIPIIKDYALLSSIMFKAGAAVFDNMYLIFAIGIAFGLAKNNDGAAGLAGAVGVLVCKNVYTVMDDKINTGVLVGIVMGIVAGMLYNKYHNIKLPEFLGFFGGKRFVPIITSISAIFIGILFGICWPTIQIGLDAFGNAVINAGAIGTFTYGMMNRLLIPVGLHHVLNSIFWFTFGEFTNAAGEVVRGDIFRFLAGDPTAGIFQAGFYPIMMFGLPAAAAAMYTTAKPENKKAVGGMLFSVALTAFLTGITEPIEFMFVFLAPALYVVHAVLTGVALATCQALGILHGFGFSAGLTDYLINFNLATKPLMLIPVGLAFAAIYYVTFVFVIKKFDILTPGREDELPADADDLFEEKGMYQMAEAYIEKLGGKGNIVEVGACITRLRLTLKDNRSISSDAFKTLGAAGIIKPNDKNIQVVVGTRAEILAEEIQKLLK